MGFSYAVHQNENNEKIWKLEQSFGNSLPTYLKWEDFLNLPNDHFTNQPICCQQKIEIQVLKKWF